MSGHRERAELLLFELRRPADAEMAIRQGLAQEPNDAGLHCLLSHVLRQQRRIREAVAAARDAITLTPDWPYALETLGWALYGDGQYRGATEAFRRALQIDPSNADYLYGVAKCLLQSNELRGGVEAAREGLALDPQHVGCLNSIAIGLATLGNEREAFVRLEAALAIAPLDPVTHANIGWVWLKCARPHRAAHWYLQALQLRPTSEQNRISLQHAVEGISKWIVWPAFVGLMIAVGLVSYACLGLFRALGNETTAVVPMLMLLPLAALLTHPRYQDTVGLFPFHLGWALHTRADRRYALVLTIGWLVSGAVAILVSLTAPAPDPGNPDWIDPLPYQASFTCPLVSLVILLDWKWPSLRLRVGDRGRVGGHPDRFDGVRLPGAACFPRGFVSRRRGGAVTYHQSRHDRLESSRLLSLRLFTDGARRSGLHCPFPSC